MCLKRCLHVLSSLPSRRWKRNVTLLSVFALPLSLCRYQYYLQLKKDVLEGRISCSLEQAIRLASLAVQGRVNLLFGWVFVVVVVGIGISLPQLHKSKQAETSNIVTYSEITISVKPDGPV